MTKLNGQTVQKIKDNEKIEQKDLKTLQNKTIKSNVLILNLNLR